MSTWYTSKVFSGQKIGKTLGFPTINLDPLVFPKNKKEGVYSSFVKYKDKVYKGALYFGPKLILSQNQNVLEVYIIDFKKNIYEQKIDFKIKNFIREPQNFSSKEEFITQLTKDIEKIKTSLS